MPLGFVKVVHSLFVLVCLFFACLFLTIVSLQYDFKLSAIYQHISAEFLESSTTSGVQILRSILTGESKYFEVVGLHGGPTISEGVQLLQHYFEVFFFL